VQGKQLSAQRLTIPIAGLRCAGSECYTLERALRRGPGVVDVYLNPVTEMAYIDYAPSDIRAGELNVQDRPRHYFSADRRR